MTAPTTESKIELSIIVPAYNEEAVLPIFHQQIIDIIKPLNISYEVIYVNDGSRDNTEAIILALQNECPEIAYAKFSRNFGKEAAMTAGFKLCRGESAIMIDADLQDPPTLIPAMLDAWRNGADIVNMKRSERHGEPMWKKVTANMFYHLIGKISEVEIPHNVGDFRLFSRRAINAINQLSERGRFMKGLYAWVGYQQATIEYERDARAAGDTKWPFFKLVGLAWQGITAFSTAPLQMATWLGLASAGSAFTYASYFLIKSIVKPDIVQGFPTLIVVILFLGGLQLFCIGILGEYLARIYTEVKQRPVYLIETFYPAK
ncbi:MAG: glycosyltransferase family 2 protein [Betaproteobacteria bacterium]